MPLKPRIVGEDSVAHLQTRLPGWLKNRIVGRAEAEGLSVQAWVANVLYLAVDSDFPPPPPARAPIPTEMDALRAYLTGERLLEPCGRPAPCERREVPEVTVDSVAYCGHCRVRIQ